MCNNIICKWMIPHNNWICKCMNFHINFYQVDMLDINFIPCHNTSSKLNHIQSNLLHMNLYLTCYYILEYKYIDFNKAFDVMKHYKTNNYLGYFHRKINKFSHKDSMKVSHPPLQMFKVDNRKLYC